MKRTAATAEYADRPYVQQPVSCRFCRSRKLKCDRCRPSCSNCKSRNHDCIYEADGGATRRPSRDRRSQSRAGKTTAPRTDNREQSLVAAPTLGSWAQSDDHQAHSTSGDEGPSLAQRVERLEQAVFASHGRRPGHEAAAGPTKTTASPLASHDEEQQKTSQWLEGLLTAGPAASTGRAHASAVAAILRDLPTYQEATALLRRFTETIDATYRMLHRPTAWNLLRVLYDDLETDRAPSPTQLAFFLYIFAGSAFVCRETGAFTSRSLHGSSPTACAERWARQAMRLITDPPVPPSVQALQTVVGLVHLCAQIEGLSGSFGALGMLGIRMAKTMNVHRLDSPHRREERRRNGADMVSVETKRRVWWHMVGSEWLLSFVGGHNEGTYMLHPRHMETLRPSNVEDADIPVGITQLAEASYSVPMSCPTSMSYFLCRLDAATLVREIVDSLPPSYFESPAQATSSEVYDAVLRLDRKYQAYMASLPFFFQLPVPDADADAYQQCLQKQPYLEWQRHLIHLVLHTQLARLHRPFLIRGSREAKYKHSRLQCIRSAEAVIEIRNRAMSDPSAGSFIYVLQHCLSAAIILAMDACYHPDRHHVLHRKQQVLRACRALEEELHARLVVGPPSGGTAAEDVSSSSSQVMVRSFQNAVASLRGTLRKHMHEGEIDGGAAAAAVASPTRDSNDATTLASLASPSNPVLAYDVNNVHNVSNVSNVSNVNSASNTTKHMAPPNVTGTANAESMPANYGADATTATTAEPGGSSELLVDELWSDFFTVGPTLNEMDWDAFLSDVGTNDLNGMNAAFL